MKTIWVFGDSFSSRYDAEGLGAWSRTYTDFKGYTPLTFCDIIGNELGYEVRNLAKGGFSNDSIFETIYQNYPLIQKEDMVIIGWSSIVRFRVVSRRHKWTNILPYFENRIDELEHISSNTISEMLLNRYNNLYKKELEDRMEFLNHLFRDNILIQWSPFEPIYNKFLFNNVAHRITHETNGKLKDGHYSEAGHLILANRFMEIIGDSELRMKCNSLLMTSNII